ncbi:primase/polymerase [Pseudomonas phage Ppu-503]|nr:primase/polymerase [Pseudomonas phage Ppu-503]
MTDRVLKYGTTSARDRGKLIMMDGSWADIVERFKKVTRRSCTLEQYAAMSPKDRAFSKNTGLFFGGECKDQHRHDDTLVCRTIVNLDLDDNCDDIWSTFQMLGEIPEFSEFSYLIHSTRSSTEDKPKFRILVPLASDIEPKEYEPVARALAYMLDKDMLAVALESYVPAQGMYFPSISKDQEYHFYAQDNGVFFDPVKALKKYPADDAKTWPKSSKETTRVYSGGKRKGHPEDKKGSVPIITALCRQFDPWEFMDEFLPHCYEPEGNGGERYRWVNASGVASVRVYDGVFVHSDHGTDPARGQHNVFDLGRIHMFGDLDKDFDTDTHPLSEWPSFKAMTKWALEQEGVADRLEEVEQEVQMERNSEVLGLLDDLDDDDDEDYVEDLADMLDDLEDEEDELEDLLGIPKSKKAVVLADAEADNNRVVSKIKRILLKAEDSDALQLRIDKIKGLPRGSLNEVQRAQVIQALMVTWERITKDKLSKADAAKMIAPERQSFSEQFGEETPKWLAPWVYVAQDNVFYHTEHKYGMPRDGFNGLYSHDSAVQFGTAGTSNNPKHLPADLALNGFPVPKVMGVKYRPGLPAIFEEHGSQWFNKYSPVGDLPTGGHKGKRGVELLKRLLADLFPEEQHRKIVLDFMAHIVQKPEQKLNYALLIKGSEQEGKSLIAKLIMQLVGPGNSHIINSQTLLEKYNGWAAECVFCTVEEVKIGGKDAHMVLNNLKPVITNSEVPIRKMQKDTYTERNFTNMLLTTNYENAIPLEDESNSRYCVLFTRFASNAEVQQWIASNIEEEGEHYVTELYTLVNESPAQFLDALRKYKFSDMYNPHGRAPMTRFKSQMAEENKTDARRLLEQLLDDPAYPTIKPALVVWSHVKDAFEAQGVGDGLRNGAVASFMRQANFFKAGDYQRNDERGRRVKYTIWTQDKTMTDQTGNTRTLSSVGYERLKRAWDALENGEEMADPTDNVIPIDRGRKQ